MYVAVVITFALGLAGLVNPHFTARLLGLDVVDPRGLSQVRATFGALHLALGAVILRGTLRRPGARSYLRAGALLVGAVFAGRLLSVLVDGVVTLVNVLFLLSEGVALTGVLLALLGAGRPRPGPRPRPPEDAAGR